MHGPVFLQALAPQSTAPIPITLQQQGQIQLIFLLSMNVELPQRQLPLPFIHLLLFPFLQTLPYVQDQQFPPQLSRARQLEQLIHGLIQIRVLDYPQAGLVTFLFLLQQILVHRLFLERLLLLRQL